jgi:TetR/AcrR family transcriptional regulator
MAPRRTNTTAAASPVTIADGTPVTPSSSAATTRERILAAAEMCFMAEGYAAGTRRIAERAGVTQPLVLHYFGTKGGLFDAVIDRALGRLIARQAGAFADEADDLDFVVRGLHTLIDTTLKDPAVLRLATWARLAGRSPFTSGSAAYWQRLVARFGAAQQSGVVRDDVDPLSLLLVLDAAVKGFGERREAYSLVAAALAERGAPVGGLSDALLSVLLHGVLSSSALPDARQRLAALQASARRAEG